MLTVKMDPALERELEAVAREAGVTKSEFVRRELQDAIVRAKQRSRPTPWDLGRDLFGKVSSGKSNLSQTRAYDLIAAKRSAKTAD